MGANGSTGGTTSTISGQYDKFVPRFGAAAAVAGGRLFVFGGVDNRGVYYRELYEMSLPLLGKSSFVRVPTSGSQPTPRSQHAMTSYNNKLYIVGGYDGSKFLNDFYEFDSLTRTWTQLSNTDGPPAADGALAVAYDGAIYVYGGNRDGTYSADVYVYVIDEGVWLRANPQGSVPPAIAYHTGVVYDGCLYSFGGVTQKYAYPTNIRCFRFADATWVPVPSGGVQVAGCASPASFLYGNTMYVFGGFVPSEQTCSSALTRARLTGPEAGIWELVTDADQVPARRSAAYAYADGCGYIAGGHNGSIEYGDFWFFALDTLHPDEKESEYAKAAEAAASAPPTYSEIDGASAPPAFDEVKQPSAPPATIDSKTATASAPPPESEPVMDEKPASAPPPPPQGGSDNNGEEPPPGYTP